MALGDQSNININRSLSDKFSLVLSNIPGVPTNKIPLFELFLKNITFPDYNLEIFTSEFLDFQIRHQVSKKNINLSSLQLDFKLSEYLENYLYLVQYIRDIKYSLSQPMSDTTETILRKYAIHLLTINFLDLKKRIQNSISFSNCFIVSISSLPLIYGSADEILFTVNISYEEMSPNIYNNQPDSTC